MTLRPKYVCLTCYIRQLKAEVIPGSGDPNLKIDDTSNFEIHMADNPKHVYVVAMVPVEGS